MKDNYTVNMDGVLSILEKKRVAENTEISDKCKIMPAAHDFHS